MVRWVTFVMFLAIATWMDLATGKIKNQLLIFMLVAALALMAWNREIPFADSWKGAVGVFAWLFPLYLIGGMGASDIKLLFLGGFMIGIDIVVVLGISLLLCGISGGVKLFFKKQLLCGILRGLNYIYITLFQKNRCSYLTFYERQEIATEPFAIYILLGSFVYWLLRQNGVEIAL